MSGSIHPVEHASLYNSPSSPRVRHLRRTSHSPSRSTSISSTSSSLTFSKEREISLPQRTSALAAQLRASQSRRESSRSSTTTSNWRREAEEEEEEHREIESSAIIEVGGSTSDTGRLPYSCKIFLHKTICGFIAASRNKQQQPARSISSSHSSPSSSSPSLSPSSCFLSASGETSLPSCSVHISEPISLSRLTCEVIACCLPSSSSIDILSLSKSFRLIAATATGKVDEDCPPLSPHQAVHHFNLSSFLFVLSHPDRPVNWSLWTLPSEDLYIGPRASHSSSLPSLFLQACREGDVEQVMAKLDEGVEVDTADADGVTGLHEAAGRGHVAILHLLCKRGVDVDRRDVKGRTAMVVGVEGGQVDCVEALMMWGASVWVEDMKGRNVLTIAHEVGNRDIVDIIEDMMKDEEIVSLEGEDDG